MNDERPTEARRNEAARGAPRPAGPAREDDPLGAALRALPAERAGAGFTGRVLARLDQPEGAHRGASGGTGDFGRRAVPGPAGWAALAAAVLAVALGLALVRGWAPRPDEAAVTADSTPTEAPAAAAPGGLTPRMPGGSESTAASLPGAPAEPAGAEGASGGEPLRPPSPPSSEPAAPGGAASAEVERMSAPTPRTESVRLAADAGTAGSRGRARDRRPSAIPPADARSALERVRAELDALRRDHRRFEVALAELPEIGRDGQPVVFLGGDEGLGLVLDLGREPAAREVVGAGDRRPSL